MKSPEAAWKLERTFHSDGVNGQSRFGLVTQIEFCHIPCSRQLTRHHMNKLYVITRSGLKRSEAEV